MKPCLMYVVRHGESTHNRDAITSGHVDPELTDNGRKQVSKTKAKLKGVKFDEVYSSDLQRAAETAEIIFGSPVPESHKLTELRERKFGAIDGLPNHHYFALRELHQPTYDPLSAEERWSYKFADDIESDYELSERFVLALEEIALKNAGKTVLVAAHGGTLRTMLIKLGYRTIDQLKNGAFGNAGYVEMKYKDGEFEVLNVDGLAE